MGEFLLRSKIGIGDSKDRQRGRGICFSCLSSSLEVLGSGGSFVCLVSHFSHRSFSKGLQSLIRYSLRWNARCRWRIVFMEPYIASVVNSSVCKSVSSFH